MAVAVATQCGNVESVSALDPAPNSNCWAMKNGSKIEIRPIHPDDEERMSQFHGGLSERSI
jgi:hypothetical protein